MLEVDGSNTTEGHRLPQRHSPAGVNWILCIACNDDGEIFAGDSIGQITVATEKHVVLTKKVGHRYLLFILYSFYDI